jgi:hypothetical protein
MITVDWATSIISIPKAYMSIVQTVPNEIRRLDVNALRLSLRDIEASEDGMAHTRIVKNSEPVSLGGVTYARVLEILAPYTITFEDGAYAVSLDGGNNNVVDRVNVNQVGVRSANSAGLTYPDVQLKLAFQSAVLIDVDTGSSGTDYPLGTTGIGVNNVTDAIAIAQKFGLTGLYIDGDLVLDQDVEGYSITGNGSININGYSIDGSSLSGLTVSGAMTGSAIFRQCRIDGVTGLSGTMSQCGLSSTNAIVMSGTLSMDFCFSDVAGSGTPTLSLAVGQPSTLSCRGYIGGVEITDMDHASDVASVDVTAGHLKLAASCSDGTLVTRGQGKLTNNSTGTTIDRAGFFAVSADLGNNAITSGSI